MLANEKTDFFIIYIFCLFLDESLLVKKKVLNNNNYDKSFVGLCVQLARAGFVYGCHCKIQTVTTGPQWWQQVPSLRHLNHKNASYAASTSVCDNEKKDLLCCSCFSWNGINCTCPSLCTALTTDCHSWALYLTE